MVNKKAVVWVDLQCSKCRQKVMEVIAPIKGVSSIVLDSSRNTVTITGNADPVHIVSKLRKFQRTASIISVSPLKGLEF